jgi:VIT1/CCC1 family predicted Fe2+/Mn2+ transporter
MAVGEKRSRTRGPDLAALAVQHQVEAIAARLAGARKHSYLGDAVLGAIDGCVTTFAVVAGAAGASLPSSIAIILGFANLIADGFSMAVSNYQRAKSECGLLEKARAIEEMHIRLVPEGEREEIRQIFAAKGFGGEELERIVEVITQNPKLWVDTMLTEELGLTLELPKPSAAALATFFGFSAAGIVPLIPYLVPGFPLREVFWASAFLTGLTFFTIGLLKGQIVRYSLLKSGLETLLIGGAAAALAYAVGGVLESLGWTL